MNDHTGNDLYINLDYLLTIGQLAAGIAHEINTPIQYIGGNLKFIRQYFSDLFRLIDKYKLLIGELQSGKSVKDLLKEIQQLEREIDLDYLREETQTIVAEVEAGARQIAEITWSMKEFAHPGRGVMETVNLNPLLEQVLNMCRNEWKYHARVEKDLAGDLRSVQG